MPTRRPKRRTPRMPKARRAAAPRPALPPVGPGPLRLAGPPTGHAVCKSCGRIVRLELATADGANLEAFADRRPDGWSAEGVSLTVTGLCARCREGTEAR